MNTKPDILIQGNYDVPFTIGEESIVAALAKNLALPSESRMADNVFTAVVQLPDGNATSIVLATDYDTLDTSAQAATSVALLPRGPVKTDVDFTHDPQGRRMVATIKEVPLLLTGGGLPDTGILIEFPDRSIDRQTTEDLDTKWVDLNADPSDPNAVLEAGEAYLPSSSAAHELGNASITIRRGV